MISPVSGSAASSAGWGSRRRLAFDCLTMGCLTLNMLLSFAQFEREIAGERIRLDRRVEVQGHVDGRQRVPWLRRQGPTESRRRLSG